MSRPRGTDQKKYARGYSQNLITKGGLSRQPCEICGVTPAECHHIDYADPDRVMWLCHRHHMQTHSQFGKPAPEWVEDIRRAVARIDEQRLASRREKALGCGFVKHAFSLFLLFLGMAAAYGSPYLVCDPYPAGLDQSTMPVTFVVTGLTGTPLSVPVFTNQDGTLQLKYDLGQLAHGTYTVTASAVNVFGGVSGASVPFVFTSGVPAVPTTLRIVP